MMYTAYHEKHNWAHCHGFAGWDCTIKHEESDGGLSHTGEPTDCIGNPGIDGTPGQDWSP